jgi:hypothetical protein
MGTCAPTSGHWTCFPPKVRITTGRLCSSGFGGPPRFPTSTPVCSPPTPLPASARAVVSLAVGVPRVERFSEPAVRAFVNARKSRGIVRQLLVDEVTGRMKELLSFYSDPTCISLARGLHWAGYLLALVRVSAKRKHKLAPNLAVRFGLNTLISQRALGDIQVRSPTSGFLSYPEAHGRGLS